MANINKIKLSGTTYSIQDENATKTVELTQAQYDALSVKDPNTFYIITDATAGDLSNYYTKSETSGATEISTALNAKADTATTYTKTETDNAITAATSTKQDTLVSGTNIKTINNQSILGSGNITIEGGGSSYTAGDGIDITNDVISVTGKASTSDVFITSSNRNSIVSNIHEEVYQLSTDDIYSISATKGQSSDTVWCQIMVDNVLYTMSGSSTSITYSDAALSSLVTADFSSNMSVTLNDRENHHINEIFFECYNNDDNSYIKEITIVHNPPIGANKIDYVAGIYTEFVHDKYAHKIDLNNKQDTLVSGTNIKTINNQSLLGSGNITIEGGTIDTTITSGSTNAVTSAAIYNQFGGLKLQKITQSAYDALVTKDANTLYVING